MDQFNRETTFFDYILSPGQISDSRYIRCKKYKWISYNPWLRKYQLVKWVARDFVSTIKRLSDDEVFLKVVVFDDITLLEAIALEKEKLKGKIELVFFFHGFELKLSDFIQERVDKILFLSKSSYLHSLRNSVRLVPEVAVVGNGVDSNRFFPLDDREKQGVRESLSIPPDAIVVSWMANNRPVKGLHLFLKVLEQILKNHNNVYALIIGAKPDESITNSRIKQLGRVTHDRIPSYLQASDFYFFTSLWKEGFGLSVVEAAKCGNWIISSDNGSIVEVLQGFPNVYFVACPNIVQEWCISFQLAIADFKKSSQSGSFNKKSDLHTYENWKMKFIDAVG
ncbi:glycosyltransferase family 4 protein [Algoriphagus sp. NG3]|uniref:glycosyltransferase family 4 protein n=1 Tax=Algoriphagus sp. NG3 TaxID=3097546 RepID=UPI002A8046B2|nr:glycosyltransferase family 4 protein [Algoriphagus sp. NG3]WPR77812.1 glycosyltransferase family 4 protein [Algoriphagus sp. NG3]